MKGAAWGLACSMRRNGQLAGPHIIAILALPMQLSMAQYTETGGTFCGVRLT